MNFSQITDIGALPFGRLPGVPGFGYGEPEHRLAGKIRGAFPRLIAPKPTRERGTRARVPQSGSSGQVLSARPFERALDRERSLADRGTRRFSLIVLRRREASRDDRRERRALGDLAQQVANRLRSTDLVGRPDPDRVEALLTDTEPAGAHVVAVWVEQLASILRLDLELTIYVYPTVDETGPDGRANDSAHADGQANGRSGSAHTNGHVHGSNGSAHTNGHARGLNGSARANSHAFGSNGAAHMNGHVHGSNGSANTNGHDHGSNGSVDTNGHTRGSDGSVDTNGHARGSDGSTHTNGHARGSDDDAKFSPSAILAERALIAGGKGSRRWPLVDLWPRLGRPTPLWKRSLDIVISSVALLALSPLFAVIAIAIRIDSPGPVFFKHMRAGRGGRPFAFHKFRSMIVDAEQRRAALASQNEKDGPIFKIRRDPRITRVGRLLRRWSLDELPQLWNVLAGDISLVGPRSPTFDEVCQYERWHRRRLSVIGGITCTWQVSGRSDISFREWMRLDMRYIACRNLWNDLRLLARTLPAVVSGRGAC